MKEFLVYHSLDGESDWTFCEDYKDMAELTEENRELFGKRYKVLRAVRVSIAEEFEELIDV